MHGPRSALLVEHILEHADAKFSQVFLQINVFFRHEFNILIIFIYVKVNVDHVDCFQIIFLYYKSITLDYRVAFSHANNDIHNTVAK